jgi:imidazolonepropionase-like amidohydrolase
MKILYLPLVTLALSAPSLAALTSAQDSNDLLQVHAKTILLSDGSRLDDGILLIEGGRIRKLGRGVELDPRFPVIEHDGFVSAGLVACQSAGGAGGEIYDSARSVLPEARMAYAFWPEHSEFEKARKAGVTSLVLSPSEANLVGGLTAVVKSAGGRIVKREAHLLLSFTSSALSGGEQGFTFFFGSARTGVAPADIAGGPENTEASQRGAREPTSYSGALAELRELFSKPEGAIARAAQGELPVVLGAWDRHEVVRAATFAQQHGLRGAVRGAALAGDPTVIAALKAAGLGVILGPYQPWQARPSLEAASKLGEAGVPFAFALDERIADPEQMRMGAAMAVAAGADPAAVWKALTSDAARIAGVDDRVGVLERGRDADFVLWSGHPLDLTSRIVAVYVDGVRVHSGPSQPDTSEGNEAYGRRTTRRGVRR